MITLNSDKGLVEVENWGDVLSRPGFRTELNPKEHKLRAIIGRYNLRDQVRCGLSDCHTPHNHGYIVETDQGVETNIGQLCGKREFGVEFKELSQKFERDITERNNRQILAAFAIQLEDIVEIVEQLREGPRGANWAYRNLQPFLSANRGCPESVVRRLAAMVKSRQSTLMREREATKQEIEAIEAAEGRNIPRPHVISEPIGELRGFAALYQENDLRALLVLDLETNLKAFRDLDIDSLSYAELVRWAKWVGTVPETLERAREAAKIACQFLTARNLNILRVTVAPGHDQRLFTTLLESLPT